MSPRSWRERIRDMPDAVAEITAFTQGMAFDAFQGGSRLGIEPMHIIKKKQMVVEAGDEGRTAAKQFYALAA